MRLKGLSFVVCMLLPSLVFARAPMFDSEQAPASPAGPWEVELIVGTVGGSGAVDGAGVLPPTRPPFVEAFPFLGLTQTTHTFPSWYYGGGAEYLNRLRPYRRIGMTGVDPVLTAASLSHRRAATLGVRISRRLTERIRGELSVERRPLSLELSREAREAIETSRAEFAEFFSGWPSGSFGSVTSAATSDASRGSEIATVASVAVNLHTVSRIMPFVRGGAGIVSRSGELPRVRLRGEYIAAPFPVGGVAQSDTLTIAYDAPTHAWVGVIGGGVRYAISRRLWARIEATSYVGSERLRIRIDATPTTGAVIPGTSVSSGTSIGFVGGGSLIDLDFSTDPMRPSSLSGPPIRGFQTFSGSAVRSRTSFTSGLSWRF
jgi:hypothetical protein